MFNKGDLVEFTYGKLGAYITRTGIYAGESYSSAIDRYTVYKVIHENRAYWVPRSCIEVLSTVAKAPSK